MQFPTLSKKQDSSKFGVELEDPSMKTKMEGGYVVSRARHTRRPRRIFQFGFARITDQDRQTLEDFWAAVAGGSVKFDWTHPISQEVIVVRFAEQMKFKYVGIGSAYAWDVALKVEEV